MKIIDAHLHFSNHHNFSQTAERSGHVNSSEHLAEVFTRNHIELGIAMGSGGGEERTDISAPMVPNLAGPLDLQHYNQPPFIAYCCGVVSASITPENTKASLEAFERCLQTRQCAGIKLYPGYNHFYVHDPIHFPFYELAQQYEVPVTIHTGDTATSYALVKYSHPLTVDEVAVRFPKVNFIMAHFGNPWLVDAAEVLAKNPNVYADLSGLAVGRFEVDWYFEHYRGYVEQLRTWLAYLSDYGKVMYGSDWPLVNIDTYVKLIARLIPEQHHQAVFYDNARRIYPRINALLRESSTGKTRGEV